MMKKSELPKPTEGELELLSILWKLESATVRELFEKVNAQRPIVYTGVLKLLQIMMEKGLVLRDERDRAHIYRAAVSQEETELRFLKELSRRFFAGSAAQLAMRALEIERPRGEDLEAIRHLLRSKRAVDKG